MMDAYIYQAALLCEDCGQAMKATLAGDDVGREDSDEYPHGPYSDGGGEADRPHHCDHCHIYLNNPLTGEGVAYVLECLEREASNLAEANRIIPKPGTAEASPNFSYWHGSPHKAIVLAWAEHLSWYTLTEQQTARLNAAYELLED